VSVFAYESGVLGLLFYGLLIVKGWALIDAITRPTEAFPAVDKLTKTAWLWILGLTFATHVVWSYPLGLFSLAGAVAAFVYLLDVRPAIVSITRRR
jgi:hypothetical protein